MKKTMKKALAIVLAIFMVVSTIPMVLATDDPSTVITDEASLQTALETGGEYILGNNIVLTDSVYHDNDVTTVIDMDGYEIGDACWEISVQAGDLTMYGGTFNKVVPIIHEGSLTLKDVTVTGISAALITNAGGKLVLENATATGKYSSCVYAHSGATVIIGGSYTCGEDDVIISYYDTIPDVKIYGGTFSKSVAEYVADGYSEAEKDGKYVVESNMKGTAGEGITWIIDCFGTLTISGTGEIVIEDDTPPWKEYNESITSVVVEEGITNLPRMFVCYATNLKTASVPSTVSDFHCYAFAGCTSLKEFNVHDDNESYKSIDGVVFTEDEKTLVAYPANKSGAEYTIPASVTTIEMYAFSSNISLESLTIPDTVTTLGNYTFDGSMIDTIIVGNGITEISSGCFAQSSIKTIVISDSVKAINYAAFWAATELETLIIGSGAETIANDILRYTGSLSVVHYKGTQETWDEISINEENADLNSKTLHFLSDDAYKAQVAPTCADGYTAGYYCDDCEAYLTGEVIPAVDEHTPGEAVEENVVAPDCTTAGSKDVVTYCTVCGEETSRETVETAEALGHTSGEAVEENIVSPDCTTAGSKDVVTYCTVCGEEASRETVETAEALGHDWNNGVCGNCGEACIHVDDNFDEICDECKAEVPITEAKLDETNTVYIPKADEAVVVKFTPAESGEYVIISDNGGDDENIDPYVDVYDGDGNYVEDDDDHNGSYNFYCIFEAEAGETYYIELSCYDGDVEYDYTIEKHVDISHQPTAGEPYVELSWDVDADYQWYSVESDLVEITDENADSCSYYGEPTVYDEETGWSGDFWDDYGASFFGIELEEGDVILVDFGEEINDEIGIWDYDRDDGFYVNDGTDTDGTIELTAPWDGYFELYAYGITRETTVKAYMDGYEYTAINGETDATLENPEIGEKYACKVILEDGTVLTSDVLEYTYAITHQPTTDEPYVGLNDDTDATYQWYSVVDSTVEITDENADTVTYDWGTSSYNAETGWSGVPYGENFDGQDFFMVSLEEGDTITVELTGDYYSGVGLWDYDAYEGVWVDSTDATSYELTAEWDGDYTFYTYQEEDGATVYVKAYMSGYEYTPINGETDSVYAPIEEGLYACEVTFADDTTEMSDVFEGPHAHDDSDDDAYCDGCDELLDPSVECDHNCHKGGIKGFFWKITNFFNRIFGLNKVCECGELHYGKG